VVSLTRLQRDFDRVARDCLEVTLSATKEMIVQAARTRQNP